MIQYEPWKISCEGRENPKLLENIFSQANGYLGSRCAFYIDGAKNHERCNYLAGGFEYISPGVTDMVNLPDLFHFQLFLGTGDYLSFSQSLDMHNGLFERRSVWKDQEGRETQINISRFISMDNKHVSALSLEVTALNYSGDVTVIMGIDGNTVNLPVDDDQTKENLDTVSLLSVSETETGENYCFLKADSKASGRLQVAITARMVQSKGTAKDASVTGCPAKELNFPLAEGEMVRIEKILYTEAVIKDPEAASEGSQTLPKVGQDLYPHVINHSFEELLKNSEVAWRSHWEQADIQVTQKGNGSFVQSALRYNIFQLIQNCPYGNSTVSIGARGLTHGRYKGCCFWDTDIFLLPFYLFTDPQAARDLILFRLNTLPDAKKNAKALNLPGARYPWMCSIGGIEQCQSWDIGRCEIHITADVAYAVENYLEFSGDETLMRRSAQLYVETARYWAGRFSYDQRKDVYNLLFVKGPDEYCGVSGNNAYTVLLARNNFKLALEAVQRKEAEAGAEEMKKWQDIIEKSQVEYDSDRYLYIQDDNFLRLEEFPGKKAEDGSASYHQYDFDWLQRYQVIKQADLVLLMVLKPELFTAQQKTAIWDFYEPLTLHDSSLSFGIHAWAAAYLGLEQKSCDYFDKSLFLDLEDRMKNTGREGIHLAAVGATWQAVVFGFAGLSLGKDGKPKLSPRLPKDWEHLSFHFFIKGKRYLAVIDEKGGRIETEEKKKG
ncbi:maltose phosphorylase/kojibiose phosphorylase [Lacrimispora xylanisolvens]|uniref:Maltose phosphorylase/kojibiose phosphorylase n=1 Tax=Lacrimispora xylanisolvens TaxID=384636 RepID=A0A2S6HW81_9FIRM|nr:glycosyl hydrolase family 65 protein [Hungatella xylanolytica]MBE5990360.1 glycoside hydrolase family 65 protein [Paenibacillaceae bacterium]PPK82167.1 maltose phosphorylase/kojibiose phosphorylase [Hungatella xylanolytica]